MSADMPENLCQWVAGWIVIWWVCKLMYTFYTKD
jgi:hypothetical protein